jgi:hypothetical protein
MHVTRPSHAWFIFNLNIEILLRYRINITIFTYQCLIQPNPLLPTNLYLLTWRSHFFASGGEYPSVLVPGLPTTAAPFASSPTLSHPTVQVTLFT